jgi:ubiquinone/menaquinone biosynthesis C-methylase UbiE
MTSEIGWSEDSTQIYRQLADIAVPDRATQLATMLMLIPFSVKESFKVVELASGEGHLSYAILRAFPNAILIALDGSSSMRDATSNRLAKYGNRATVGAFDMIQLDWHSMLDGADFVVSSLCIHHLDGDQKKLLFNSIENQLSERGAFIIADLLHPQHDEARRLFEATWNQSARNQSLQKTGDTNLYELFTNRKWNYYTHPHPIDKPSSLFDQLQWLSLAGFGIVDCFWLQAGHAIFGGFKSINSKIQEERLLWQDALHIALHTLQNL